MLRDTIDSVSVHSRMRKPDTCPSSAFNTLPDNFFTTGDARSRIDTNLASIAFEAEHHLEELCA